MADAEHAHILLHDGVDAWNNWRREHPDYYFEPDLSECDLARVDLSGANLSSVNLSGADLTSARLIGSDLRFAQLYYARLYDAKLAKANLTGAHLTGAYLVRASLVGATLPGMLIGAELAGADLSGVDLKGRNLTGAGLNSSVLDGADLSGANLEGATMIGTSVDGTNFAGCRVYGLSVWDIRGRPSGQRDLIITPTDQSPITVDNLKVAQFLYLLINNEEIRDVIDTITSKVVLILGRFTLVRREMLEAMRGVLRQRDYSPIIFDFDKPSSKNVTDTVKLLAQMARYVIVDLSDPNSAPYELGVISMLGLDTTPVVPVIVADQVTFPMLDDILRKPWCTALYRYKNRDELVQTFDVGVIARAEAKLAALRAVPESH
jgi:uncharacterized protein YjbI with pentapeptide repeats